MIPKRIHQTYPTHAVPEAIAGNIGRLLRENPGWTHTLYDDADIEDFIRRHYKPMYLELYRRINPAYGAARADFFRYLVVYRLGGVYLDIKSSATAPLDEVLMPIDRYVLTHWPNRRNQPFQNWSIVPDLPNLPRGEFQNWHIIAEPQHPFLHHVIEVVMERIESYDRALVGTGREGILRTTGPVAYTQALVPLLASYPHRLAGDHLELGLQYNILEGQGVGSHLQLFPKRHYSLLDEPVVLPIEKSSTPPGVA